MKVTIDGIEYPSFSEAERKLGFSKNAISKIIRYREGNTTYRPIGSNKVYTIVVNKNKPITDKQRLNDPKKVWIDDVEYPSFTIAEKKLGFSKRTLSQLLMYRKGNNAIYTPSGSNISYNIVFDKSKPMGKKKITAAKKVWVDDVEYNSYTEADQKLGFPKGSIAVIKHKAKNKKENYYVYTPRNSKFSYKVRFEQ